MELKDYLRILRRRWLMVVTCVLLVVGAAAALTFTTTPVYQSTARLFVSTSGDGGGDVSSAYQGGLFSQQRVSSYADLVGKSEQLAEVVIDDLDLKVPPGEVLGKVSASVSPETVNIELSATDPDPTTAQAIAQSYAMGLSDLVRRLETPSGANDPLIKASVVDDATLPSSPVTPQPVRNLGLAFLLGLLLGFGLAVARELLDTSVKSPDEIAAATDAPLLGSIAYDASVKTEPLVSNLDSHAPRAEGFRVMRTNLQFVDVDASTKVFVVTSAVPGEGKTTTAVNLALTLAQAGQKTLLVEGDLRRPKAALTLDMDGSVGVTTVLLGKVSLEDALQEYATTGLAVLASGAIPPNPAELLQSRAMTDLLARCRQQFDTVIIDAPPLLPVTDAALISTQADGAILVVAHGRTTRDQVAQAAQRLGAVDATLVGAVLNMTPSRRGGGTGYGYGYGYGYAPSDNDTRTSRPGRRVRSAGSDTPSD